jgi:hypothetical protein
MNGNGQNDNGPGDGWEIEDDLDKVESRKDVAAGRWLVRVATMEKKSTKDRSKDYFNICFEIVDCMDAKDEDMIGAKAWDLFNINQSALWKLKALISACGFDAHGSRIPNLTDCEVVLDTYEETYEGNRSMKTKRYKNPEQDGWIGINQSRDSSTPAKEPKVKAPATAKAPATTKTSGLAGKKLGGGKPPVADHLPENEKDDEVEI